MTGEGRDRVDAWDRDRTTARARPTDASALTDDPTRPADGLDPGETGSVPLAPRHHGGVIDPAHPDFFTTAHRNLRPPDDPLAMPERRLTVDDHASQTAGPGAATQATMGRPAETGETRPDAPGDPRADRPDAQPA